MMNVKCKMIIILSKVNIVNRNLIYSFQNYFFITKHEPWLKSIGDQFPSLRGVPARWGVWYFYKLLMLTNKRHHSLDNQNKLPRPFPFIVEGEWMGCYIFGFENVFGIDLTAPFPIYRKRTKQSKFCYFHFSLSH